MDSRFRAYCRLIGFLLVLLAVLDVLVLSTLGVNTPINPRFDQAGMYVGFALLVLGV